MINNTHEARQVAVPLARDFLADLVQRIDNHKGFQVTLFRFEEDEHEIIATTGT